MTIHTRWEEVEGEDATIPLAVAGPTGQGVHPGLVVFHGGAGLEPDLPLVERLAGEGFVCIAPDLFYRWATRATGEAARTHVPKLTEFGLAQDFRVVLNHLKSLPNVDRRRVGVVGYCLGGDNAFLAACFNSDVKAAVVCYGGRIVTPDPGRIRALGFAARLKCPVLSLSGDQDQRPSPEHIRLMAETLTSLGKQLEYHIYPGAGHAFFSAGSRAYHAPSAEKAWPVKVQFLRRHLAEG